MLHRCTSSNKVTRKKKNSFFKVASIPIDPPFDLGVGKQYLKSDYRPFFINWISQIHDVWEINGKDERLITTQHEGLDIFAVIRYLLILLGWMFILYAFQSTIKRSLYKYDSLSGFGVKHTKAIMRSVQKLSRMIPFFLLCTDYYGKRKDIDWNTNVHYSNIVFGEPLAFEKHENIPQQNDES
ncbi:hypothetical protein H5410_061305, partial [Solanum commersonii]